MKGLKEKEKCNPILHIGFRQNRHLCKHVNSTVTWKWHDITHIVKNTHYFFFIIYLVCEAIGTAATHGLSCHSQEIVKMIVEKQMECRLAGETEVFWENLPQCHFCPSQNPTWPDPGLNPGRHGGKPATNRLSYGAPKNTRTSVVLRNKLEFDQYS
jgi:hypothetical protein